VWSAGALVSNIGTWMQRVAQDWLVLTQLTHHDASAVGIVMALQFAPQLLLLPWTGFAADHLNQRKLLMVTQATMGVLALALGILTITGNIRLWQVYVFAFLFGSRLHWMLQCARPLLRNWWVTSTCIMQSH
jgi:MFS family permease